MDADLNIKKNHKNYLVLKIIKFSAMKFINIYIFIFFVSLPVKSDQFDSRLVNLFDELYFSEDAKKINIKILINFMRLDFMIFKTR